MKILHWRQLRNLPGWAGEVIDRPETPIDLSFVSPGVAKANDTAPQRTVTYEAVDVTIVIDFDAQGLVENIQFV